MNRYTSILKKSCLALSSLGLFLAPNNAWAGSQIFDNQDTCTTTNCGAIVFNGQTLGNQSTGQQAQPFILQVFSSGNQCMRLDVINQTADQKAVLVSPSGRVWINDDGSGNNRPLIKANTDINGWYTLQIFRFNGLGVAGDFTLAYGLYNSGNPNCSSPTTPLAGSNAPK